MMFGEILQSSIPCLLTASYLLYQYVLIAQIDQFGLGRNVIARWEGTCPLDLSPPGPSIVSFSSPSKLNLYLLIVSHHMNTVEFGIDDLEVFGGARTKAGLVYPRPQALIGFSLKVRATIEAL